jgi:hypothetical protein
LSGGLDRDDPNSRWSEFKICQPQADVFETHAGLTRLTLEFNHFRRDRT